MATTMEKITNGNWQLTETGHSSQTYTKKLLTAGHFIDRDVDLSIKARSGAYTLSASSVTLTPSLSIDTAGVSGATNVGSSASKTTPSSGYFVAVKTGAEATELSVTADVTTAGWISSDKTTTGTVTLNSSGVYYIPITSGVYSATQTVSLTNTAAVKSSIAGSIATAAGVVKSAPSGQYLTIIPKGEVTSNTKGTVTATANITTAGYIPTGSKTDSETINQAPNTSLGDTLYLPYVTPNITGGTGSGSLEAVATTNMTTATSGDYYVTATANGKISVGAVTYTNSAGYLAANSTAITAIAAQTNKDLASDSDTLYIPTAKFSTSYSNENLSTYFNSATSKSTGTVVITPKYKVTTAGYTPTSSDVNGTTAYWNIKTGSLAKSATTNVEYTPNTSMMLDAEGSLYINRGWYEPTVISLATLIPDDTAYSNAGNANILSGFEAYDTNGKKLIGTIATVTPSTTYYTDTNTGYGAIGDGYIAGIHYIKKGVHSASGSASATVSSVSVAYDSTNDRFTVSGSKALSGTAYSKVTTAGWLPIGNATAAISGSATVSAPLAKIALNATITGASKVTPDIVASDATGNGATKLNISPTTTATKTGYFIAVTSNAKEIEITATPGVASNGYGTAANHAASPAKATVGADASSDYYLPIPAGGCEVTGGGLSFSGSSSFTFTPTLTLTPMSTNVSMEVVDNNPTGYYVSIAGSSNATTGGITVIRGAIQDKHTAGYIPAKDTTTVIDQDSKTGDIKVNSGSKTRYIQITSGAVAISGGVLSAGAGSVSVTAGTNLALTSTATTGYYSFTATGSGKVKKSAITSTLTEGYIGDKTTQITADETGQSEASSASATTTRYIKNSTISATSITPNATTNAKQTVTITSGYYHADRTVTVNAMDAGDHGASVTHTVTDPKVASSVTGDITTAAGVSTTKPITSGTYLTITPSMSITAGTTSATARSSITKSGYLANGSVQDSATNTLSISASLTNGSSYYLNKVTPTVSGGALSNITTSANATTNMATATSGTYYVTAAANASASVGAVNLTTAAGYTNAINTTGIEAQEKDGSASKTIYIPTAAGSSTTTSSTILAGTNATLSDTDNGIYVTGSGSASSTTKITTAGYTPTNTSFVTSSGTSSETKYLSGVKLAAPSSGTRKFSIQVPNGSTTNFITFTFTVDSSGNVTVAES